MRKINKQGSTNWVLPTILFVLVIGLFAIGYVAVKQQTYAPDAKDTTNPNTGATIPTGPDCGNNPAVSYAFSDALQPGTTIAAGGNNFVDASTLSPTLQKLPGVTVSLLGAAPTFQVGQSVIPIVNATGYIREIQSPYQIVCGNQQLKGDLYAYGNGTISIYNNARTAVLTNSATCTIINESASTSSLNEEVDITGNTYKSTSTMLVVVEVGTKTNVSSVTLSGANAYAGNVASAAVPAGYSNTLTNPYVAAFEVPPITAGVKAIYNLNIAAANGNTIQGAVYTTWYAEQGSVDSITGVPFTGAFDSNNVAKYIDKQTSNFCIK